MQLIVANLRQDGGFPDIDQEMYDEQYVAIRGKSAKVRIIDFPSFGPHFDCIRGEGSNVSLLHPLSSWVNAAGRGRRGLTEKDDCA